LNSLSLNFFRSLKHPSVWVCKGRKPFLISKTFLFFIFKVLQCLSFFSFPLQHRFFYPLYELPLLFEAAAKVRISF
ncbi:hypothetical protein, partial [Mucilaginibacter rubeus]|uniref:hypothetical protein n=1 Tax=Mucilaginibacter rubeus TaxID=2027860 RepID=UPI003FA44E8E